MNKRRIVFEVTVDSDPRITPSVDLMTLIMTAVFNGIVVAKLPVEARVVVLEDKGLFEGVVPKTEVRA
jgi:hypothetical protein